MNYDFQAITSVIRLTVGFLFVFGFVTPLFFGHIRTKSGIDRIVFSWVALGGLLVIGIFGLVSLHIYDFISILFCLLMLPLLIHFFKHKWEGETIVDIFNLAEHKLVANQVLWLERVKGFTFQQFKDRLFKKKKLTVENPYTIAVVFIGIIGSALRIVPAIKNSSPFSRIWYYELDAVKGLSLQQYFSGYPSPKGMHSIIHFFSTITQVSPEMILHLIGALVSFFLALIIFWLIRDITRGEHQAAALFGAMIYAVFPTLFLPVSMELESEMTSLAMALCFALPTMTFYMRNIRSGGKTPWFYIFMGVAATGFTDLFVLLMVLLPFLLIGLTSIPKQNFITNFGKTFFNLLVIFTLTLSPYVIYCLYYDFNITTFFQDQLFNTQVFSLAPNLIMPVEDLSMIYAFTAFVLLVGYIIRLFVKKRKRIGDAIVFISFFILISYIYTPYFDYQYVLIDPDQLNSFFGVMICIFAGLLMYSVIIFLEWIFESFKKITPYLAPSLTTVFAICFVILQGGFEVSRILPKTQPNGFFDAYYNIINERVPYTYATVGPDLDSELAKNRHYFMNYEFFLNNYGAIDSLYQQYLTVPDNQRPEEQEVPPASIFIFVEKPPYGSIQQGILYDAQRIMRDMEQWLASFRQLEGRKVNIYYETEETIIYEIVNRKSESTISGVLRNIYPEEKGRAERIFK